MGKLAKQRRYRQRKDAAKIREMQLLLCSATNERDHAEQRLRSLERRVRDFCAYSTLLRAEAEVPKHILKVPIEERRYRARFYDADFDRLHSMPVESLMQMIACDDRLGDELRRCVHFRVVNPPKQHPDFVVGYAVSHFALEQMARRRDDFVRLIAENIAGHVHEKLFP